MTDNGSYVTYDPVGSPAVRDPGRAMWTVYAKLDVFDLEHRRCGEMDGGGAGDLVGMTSGPVR